MIFRIFNSLKLATGDNNAVVVSVNVLGKMLSLGNGGVVSFCLLYLCYATLAGCWP